LYERGQKEALLRWREQREAPHQLIGQGHSGPMPNRIIMQNRPQNIIPVIQAQRSQSQTAFNGPLSNHHASRPIPNQSDKPTTVKIHHRTKTEILS
jgi:hypothetical protein